MKILNKRALIILILFILLVTLISAGYIIFFGPPFGRAAAEKEIDEYINVMYRDRSMLRFVDYSMPSHLYKGICIIGPSLEPTTIAYDYSDNTIIDYRVDLLVTPKFDKDLEKIKQGVSKDLNFNGSVRFTTKVDSNFDYTDDVSKLKLKTMIMFHIRNHNTKQTEIQSKELFIATAENIIKGFDAFFNINRIEVIYTDVYGLYELNVKSNNTSDLLNKIKKSVKKKKSDEISLNELEFISRLKQSK